MIQKESILGHIVSYDPDSVFQDLDTILASRF